jgi:hypothetical protein
MKELDPYIIELESKIQILERENEVLSSKAEENLLLNRAFQEINNYEDIHSLFENTLESIAVLLNIQFTGIFTLNATQFICLSSYALFSNHDTTDVQFEVPENTMEKLKSSETCFLTPEMGIKFHYPKSNFVPTEAVVIPFESETEKSRYFLFVNDYIGYELEKKIQLFEKIISVISAKLDKIYFQYEQKKLNEEN